jgi:hypothetical protein
MHGNPPNIRIVALDLRLQRFGFVVMEGHQQLLEWGTRTYRTSNLKDRILFAQRRIVPLLTSFRPSVVVLNHVQGLHGVRGPSHYRIVQAIEHEAAQRSAALVLIGRQEIRRAFRKAGEITKDEIAAHVALLFPALTWKLPPTRKTWMSEHHNMTIFDAASLGITYLARFSSVAPIGVSRPETPSPG